ncbi:MAG: hypothetical protein NC816_01235 [Candidatus Omnitrophica bacterium]|nr:hypothetical protein [Candidatus Omnitrophota bacterium]
MPQQTFDNFIDLKNYFNNSPSTKSDDSLIKSMIDLGKMMDEDISDGIKLLKRKYPSHSLLNISIIHSLIWSGHAIDAPQFYLNSLEYLKRGKESYLEKAIAKSGRFGEESLKHVLKGWFVILENFGDYDFARIKADRIVQLQEIIWKLTYNLLNENMIRGIGNWLLLAPFKIIVAYRRTLWENKNIDQLRMPLGLEVIRGIHKLMRKKSKYLDGFAGYMFYEQEKNFLEDKTVVEIVHNISRKIAEDYDTRAIHVNSGLYLLGKDEI